MALIEGGADESSSSLTVVTADSSAHSKGSWTELLASTSQDIEWLVIQLDVDDGPTTFLIDIGVGDPTPAVVVPDLAFYSKLGSSCQAHRLVVPCKIASGSKISARCQAAGASDTVKIAVIGGGSTAYGTCSNIDAIGADDTLSKGTVVDPDDTTADTKGDWVELVGSSAAKYDWVVVCMNFNNNTGMSSASWLVDIGTGAALAETVLIPNIFQGSDVFEIGGHRYQAFQVSIPSGTRIVARAQCSILDATDRKLDVMLLGCEFVAPSGGGGSSLFLPPSIVHGL